MSDESPQSLPPDAMSLDAWLTAFPRPPGMTFMLRPDGPGVTDGLYTVAALYAGFDPADPASWSRTYDHAAYDWFIDKTSGRPRRLDIAEALAARLHDAAMEAAIDRHLSALPAKVIGFMGGPVFAPGEAGAVQEVFQDVTLNYYRPAGVKPTPIVFVGKAFWDPGPGDAPT